MLATYLVKSAIEASAKNKKIQSFTATVATSPDSTGAKRGKSTIPTATFSMEDSVRTKKKPVENSIRIQTIPTRPGKPVQKLKIPEIKTKKNPADKAPVIPVRFKSEDMVEVKVCNEDKKGHDEQLVSLAVEKLKKELPGIMEEYLKAHPPTIESRNLDSVHLGQIAAAQEFLNENSKADLSRIKCLLRKMFSKEYHDVIDCLKQHKDPQFIINIHGGQNVIPPKAMDVQQG